MNGLTLIVMESPFDRKAELTTILVVEDIPKALSFYLDVLGAELFREYGGDSAVIKFLGSWILLVTAGGETDDKPGTEFIPPADRSTISHSFTIRVEDCPKTYQELESRGAEFLTPPFKNGPETRCFFYDPDGHLFEISEYSA